MPDAKTVAALVEVPRQTLQYWCVTGLLHVEGGGGPWQSYCFKLPDILRAMAIVELKRQGAPLQTIRTAVRALEELHEVDDWQMEFLAVAPGGAVIWLKSTDQIIDVNSGQLYLIDVAALRKRLPEIPTVRMESPSPPRKEKVKRAQVRRTLPRDTSVSIGSDDVTLTE